MTLTLFCHQHIYKVEGSKQFTSHPVTSGRQKQVAKYFPIPAHLYFLQFLGGSSKIELRLPTAGFHLIMYPCTVSFSFLFWTPHSCCRLLHPLSKGTPQNKWHIYEPLAKTPLFRKSSSSTQNCIHLAPHQCFFFPLFFKPGILFCFLICQVSLSLKHSSNTIVCIRTHKLDLTSRHFCLVQAVFIVNIFIINMYLLY